MNNQVFVFPSLLAGLSGLGPECMGGGASEVHHA